MCRLVARGDRRGARPGSRPASRSRTGGWTASRCRAASPHATRSMRCSWRPGSTGKGVVLATAGRAVHLRRHVRAAAAHRPALHLAALRSPERRPLPAAAPARGERAAGLDLWPQVTPRPLTMQFTLDDAVQPERRGDVRRAHEGESRGRSPRTAIPPGGCGRPPISSTRRDEAALGHLRGLGVRALPGARGPARGRPRGGARRQPARRDVRPGHRRGSRHAVPRVHRERRRRRSRATCSPTITSRWAFRTPARTSTSCATHRWPPTCWATGCASAQRLPIEQAVRKLSGEPADMFGFVRRGYLREGNWADLCVFDPRDDRPRAGDARPRLPGRRRTSHRRGAHRAAPRARERHADPRRRAAARRARSPPRDAARDRVNPRSPEAEIVKEDVQ